MTETINQTSVAPSVPKGRGALDAFLNLLSLITLGWSAWSLGSLLFMIISKFYSVDVYSFNQTTLKFNIASLIIVVPVFLGITAYLHKSYKTAMLTPHSGIHRWLTYLMLLISALNIIGSLIAVIYKLLDGDYTLGTILKILTVFVIACGIFGYYWYDLRRKDFASRGVASLASLVAVIVIVLAAIVGSFFLVDPPRVARMKNFDNLRVNDLYTLSNMIVSDYQNTDQLPADFSAAKYSSVVDPETKQAYEYKRISDKNYELCATFSLPADQLNDKGRAVPMGVDDWYYHNSGYQCFARQIDQNLLKPASPTDRPVIIQ